MRSSASAKCKISFYDSGNTMKRLLGLAIVAMMMACGFAAHAEEATYDPGKISASLKAIFQFGSVDTKKALNANTVTLITGTIGGTYVQFGADLSSVLDDGNKLRVLPIVGRGSVQSIADILFLQGVDIGVVRADSLDYLEKKGIAHDLRKQLTYVTKLYNEEMQVIAPVAVRNLRDLDGKRVSVDLPDGSTFVTALAVFERLGLQANNFAYLEQRIAMEKLKKGELDAVIVVGGKPYKSVSNFVNDGGRFHLVTVDYDRPLQGDYLPANMTSKDYRKLSLFVDAFFTKFPALQNPPFHPKWKEVSLSAPLPGWQRLPSAKQWLDQHGIEPVARNRFEEFPAQTAAPAAGVRPAAAAAGNLRQAPAAAAPAPAAAARPQTAAEQEALFKQFQAWEAERNASAQARPAPQLPR